MGMAVFCNPVGREQRSLTVQSLRVSGDGQNAVDFAEKHSGYLHANAFNDYDRARFGGE